MELTGAEIIAECLLEQAVQEVFGYPGGAVLNIYDALYLYRDRIHHTMTAHEQGAAHAADGYSRATGKTGVVFATSGPGATNLVTGIASAYMDSSPMVAITGNVSRDLLGRDSFQEVNIKDIVKPVTKASFQVMEMEELAPTIRKAFEIARTGRKGPVLVDVPKDITALKTEYVKTGITYENKTASPDKIQIEAAVRLIQKAKRPMLYAGGGVIGAQAARELTKFAELCDAPVFCSLMGLGGIDARHPLFFGNIGMHGMYESGMATQNADLIIALGARFSDRVAGDRERFRENAEIIHIDIDEKEIDKNVKTSCHLCGDLKDILKRLNEVLPQQAHSGWLEQVTLWKNERPPVVAYGDGVPTPQHILRTVNSMKKPGDIIVTDVGQHQMWTAQECRFERPRTFLTSGGLGTMGFGMGAAIGAQTAHPKERVTLITGDGSFHMNCNELVTLKSYRLPVAVVIMNNSVLGMVRQWQTAFYGKRFSQTDPHRKTNFVKLAEGFGLKGYHCENLAQFQEAFADALKQKGPTWIECMIDKDEKVLPMIPGGGDINDIIMK